jgi:hypothetical protein
MVLYWLELKKLLTSAAAWVFIAICLLFNVYLAVSSSDNKYADFVGTASNDTGYVLGQSFYEKLSQLTASVDQADYLDRLKSETDNVADVFDGYETKGIGESYIAAAGATGSFAEAMRDKYAALQKVVDEKAATDESLTLYFAGATYSQHHQLFNGLTGCLLIEGAFISVLLVLLAVGYENNHRTENIVYSTKTGRHILRSKIMASTSAGLGAYAILALFTFLVYFSLNEYGEVWSSSVSSVFNYRYDFIAGNRPFVTWHSFSVLTYFLAMLGMSAGVILCFSLMAFGIGILIRNNYIGFLVFLAVNAIFVVIPLQIPKALTAGFFTRYYSMLSPVWLWLKHSIWFTDGDADILWPHFETLGLCASFLFLTALCILATVYFRKRDLT